MKKIIVTGGSGRAGHEVIKDLLDHGYAVLNIDIKPPKERLCPSRIFDMTDYGKVFAAMYGYDAIVHLAADPRPDRDNFAGAERFHNNTLSTYNVFNAAVTMQMQRVVWASSETIHGYPYETTTPQSVPVTEEHPPIPTSSYAISKLVSEEMARQFNRLSGIPFIGLRFSNILYEHDYERVPDYWQDSASRKFNLWGYVDGRDVAQSVRLSLEADIQGAEAFSIVAADTIMNRTNRQLMAEQFPDVPIREGTGHFDTLTDINKARKMLGYDPKISWRDYIEEG